MGCPFKANSVRRSTARVRDRRGDSVYKVSPAAASLENLDFMTADPNVDLLEACLQSFLVVAEEIIRWTRRGDVDNETPEQVFVNRSLILPRADSCDEVERRCGKIFQEVECRLTELTGLDGTTVVIAQW